MNSQFLDRMCQSLSLICRYGGDVRWNGRRPRFESVAEHTVHMVRQAHEDGIGPEGRLAIWLHDAPEFIIGDQLPIIKSDPDAAPIIREHEQTVMRRICDALDVPKRFGEYAMTNELVKKYDKAILAAESTVVANAQPNWDPFNEENELHVKFQNRLVDAATYATNFHFWSEAMKQQFDWIRAEM